MAAPQINRSWFALPSYVTEFPLQDRLGDLLREAVIRGTITEEEHELITTAVTDEARSRHAAVVAAEAYREQLAADAVRQREERRQRDADWRIRMDERHVEIERAYREWVEGGGLARLDAQIAEDARSAEGVGVVQEAEAC